MTTIDGYTQKTVLLNYGDHSEIAIRMTQKDINDPDYAYVIISDCIYLAEYDEEAELYAVDMLQE